MARLHRRKRWLDRDPWGWAFVMTILGYGLAFLIAVGIAVVCIHYGA